jgi:hypothetical protein
MGINVFEGARRITKIFSVLWVVGAAVFSIESISEPNIHPYFEVESLDSKPVRLEAKVKECGADDVSEYVSPQTTSKGNEVKVTLCFKASTFKNSVIKDFNTWTIKDNPSSKVVTELPPAILSEVSKNIAKKFKLSKADEEWADSEVWKKRWEKIQEASLIAAGGMVAILIFSWVVGWIVRGFMGISSGHDFKP